MPDQNRIVSSLQPPGCTGPRVRYYLEREALHPESIVARRVQRFYDVRLVWTLEKLLRQAVVHRRAGELADCRGRIPPDGPG